MELEIRITFCYGINSYQFGKAAPFSEVKNLIHNFFTAAIYIALTFNSIQVIHLWNSSNSPSLHFDYLDIMVTSLL